MKPTPKPQNIMKQERPYSYLKSDKRRLDLMLTTPIILMVSPLLGIIALLIKLQMGRPALFKQLRPGLHGKLFTIYKFRTMTDARDSAGYLLPDARRLTRLGQLLRTTSLDELPELWNVLKGDMSLVGPRPLLKQYLGRYSIEQARRHEAKPGLTGWAQVNGRNAITWAEKFTLDVFYVNNQSLALDLKIIAMSIKKILMRDEISYKDQATMPEFSAAKSESTLVINRKTIE